MAFPASLWALASRVATAVSSTTPNAPAIEVFLVRAMTTLISGGTTVRNAWGRTTSRSDWVTQSLRLVVLPQAFRTVVPPLINVVIALTKNTSIAGAFGVVELTAVATRLANAHSDAGNAILLAATVCYLAQ